MSENAHDFRTVREATLEILRQLGLTTIFSNPSHTEMKLFEDWPDDFRFVMGLQEASVVGMADGYAQATGQASLVIINGGPGLGNAMGSVYTAATAHTPMVILGGQQARKMVAGEPFLNARHATQLPQPYIKWAGEPAARRTFRRCWSRRSTSPTRRPRVRSSSRCRRTTGCARPRPTRCPRWSGAPWCPTRPRCASWRTC